MTYLFHHADISVSRDDSQLILGNSHFTRTFDLSWGTPRTISLKTSTGQELASPAEENADFAAIGLRRAKLENPFHIIALNADLVPASWHEKEHVKVTMTIHDPIEQTLYSRIWRIHPGLPAISSEFTVQAQVMPKLYWNGRGNLPTRGAEELGGIDRMESCVDHLKLAKNIIPRRTVELIGRTDYTDDLVIDHPFTGDRSTGSLFYASNDNGAGIIVLHEAPPSRECRDYERHDFRMSNGELYSCTAGFQPGEFSPEKSFQSYRHVVIVYETPEEGEWQLKQFLRERYPFEERHSAIVVNPWGCGNFPSRVSGDFFRTDFSAAAEVGATHYQIDDGWQSGNGLAEIVVENKPVNDDYWKVSPKLGGSFDQVKKDANDAGIQPALWLAPSCNAEYRDWEKTAAWVLDFHRKYGFSLFKIDAVMLRTYESEQNLRRLFEKLRSETHGDIYLNLDTTNGQRPGYFHFLEYGNIFLENRYACHLWARGYHPEIVLRTLWQLAHFTRIQTLQIEIANPADINEELYKTKLSNHPHPCQYRFDYWAMIAFFANPLLWMTPSTLPEENRMTLHTIMALYQQLRPQIHHGEIFAIGDEPDGKAICGFHSCNRATNHGYFLFFRELCNQESRKSILLPFPLTMKQPLKLLAGTGKATVAEEGNLAIEIDHAGSYVLYEY